MREEMTKAIKQTVWADAKSTVQDSTSNLLRALQKRINNYNVKGIVFTGYLPLTWSYFDKNKVHYDVVNLLILHTKNFKIET